MAGHSSLNDYNVLCWFSFSVSIFLYSFSTLVQEVVVEGEDKVFKDVIEPLESVSVNLVPSSKESIRDFGSPQQVC